MSYSYTAVAKPATAVTAAHNRRLAESADPYYLAQEDADVAAFARHLIYRLPNDQVNGNDGKPSLPPRPDYAGSAPDTVNPYLWRLAARGQASGIAELVPGQVYQSAGIGGAQIGFIRSAHGWIVQDAGCSDRDASLALDALEAALGEQVRGHVQAIILSHTHVDHFGGLDAVIAAAEHPDAVPFYAPAGYIGSLSDDNLYTGTAMARRIQYQVGSLLSRGPQEALPFLGSTVRGAYPGRVSRALPNRFIGERQTVEIDGVHVDFIPLPHTETTAHLVNFFEEPRALFLADDVLGALHNTLTIRGARVRDAGYWGEALYEIAEEYADRASVVFYGHDIPLWNTPKRPHAIRTFVLDNAVAYKYTNDEALLKANEGVPIGDLGRAVELPDTVTRPWYVRPHYGTFTHNARASYQQYLGFYDGNPVHLDPLPEAELARHLVAYAGGADALLKRAERDFEAGEYQWVATVTNHLVFADPANRRARLLCADALEQLAYQAESSLWRNAYLSAALDLRDPQHAGPQSRPMTNDETVALVPVAQLLDYRGVALDGAAVERDAAQAPTGYAEGGVSFELDVADDLDEAGKARASRHVVTVYKGTVLHREVPGAGTAGGGVAASGSIPLVTTTRRGLIDLAEKRYQESSEPFETDRPDILAWLDDHVVDLARYRDFNLVEPLA